MGIKNPCLYGYKQGSRKYGQRIGAAPDEAMPETLRRICGNRPFVPQLSPFATILTSLIHQFCNSTIISHESEKVNRFNIPEPMKNPRNSAELLRGFHDI